MSWGSWSDFASMGGYALYVWGSYFATAALLTAEVVFLALRKRTADAQVRAATGGTRGRA